MSAITEAIMKLESAPEPSRELDLLVAFHARHDYGRDWVSFLVHEDKHGYEAAFTAHSLWIRNRTPLFTQSFDQALLLLPKDCDYELTVMGTPDGATWTCAGVRYWPKPRQLAKGEWRCRDGNKLIPAMALCIAALKVRADLDAAHAD